MLRINTLVAGIGAACCALPAHAQTATPAAGREGLAGAAAITTVNSSVANGPNDRALKTGTGPDIQLVATADEKVVSMAWSHNFSSIAQADRLSFSQFTLKASTALDDSGSTTLLGLSGFPGGTEVSLSFTHFMGRFQLPASASPEAADLEAAIEGAKANCRDRHPRGSQASLAKLCDPDSPEFVGSLSSFIEEYNRAELAPQTRQMFGRTFTFFGAEFAGNQDNYKYLDAASFTLKKGSKFGYRATAFAGLLFTNTPTSITGSFTYSRHYDAQEPITLCQAINAVPQTQCLTAPNGAPGVTRSAIFALEARHAFNLGSGMPASLAIAPEVSFDIKNKKYAVDVPIYFAQDSSSKLRGGMRIGYVNAPKAGGGRDGDFTIGLFIGAPFSLLQ